MHVGDGVKEMDASPATPPPPTRGRDWDSLEPLGVSRLGLASWSASLDGERVKIYQCHSAAQASLIEDARTFDVEGIRFPHCPWRDGDWVAATWIEGTVWDRKALRDRDRLTSVARFQAALHRRKQETPTDGLDYPGWLRRRAAALAPPDLQSAVAAWTQDSESPGSGSATLSHPDLTPANVVAGHLIDNELLGYGPVPLLDLFNTLRTTGWRMRSLARPYAAAYSAAGGDLSPLADNPGTYLALWNLRLLGSYCQSGAPAKARALVARGGERSDRHPLCRAARGLTK